MTRILAALIANESVDLYKFQMLLKEVSECDGYILTDNGWGVNCLMLALLTKEETGRNAIPHFILRDKNRIALKSDLTSCQALGIKDVILSTGPHPDLTPYPDAKPVYDLDLRQALKFALAETNLRIGAALYLGSSYQWDLAAILAGEKLEFLKIGIEAWRERNQDLAALKTKLWWEVKPEELDDLAASLAGCPVKPEAVVIPVSLDQAQSMNSIFTQIKKMI